MKMFLLTGVVAPTIDFFANNGRCIDIALGYLARAAYSIVYVGATLMPSIG